MDGTGDGKRGYFLVVLQKSPLSDIMGFYYINSPIMNAKAEALVAVEFILREVSALRNEQEEYKNRLAEILN